MSVDTKSSMSDKKCQPSAGSHRRQLHHSSSSLNETNKQQQIFPNNSKPSEENQNPNDIEHLRHELNCEKQNRCGRKI